MFCFLKKRSLARSSRQVSLTCSVSVQYHPRLCPAREQPEGTFFSSSCPQCSTRAPVVLLVLSFVHRQEYWRPISDGRRFAKLSVQCSEVSTRLRKRLHRVSACPPSPIWTDVPGLGISLSLVNFDEHLRVCLGFHCRVGVRIPVQGLVDADMEPVVAFLS